MSRAARVLLIGVSVAVAVTMPAGATTLIAEDIDVPAAMWEDISPPISFDFGFNGENFGSQTIGLSVSDPRRVYVGSNYQGIWTTVDAGDTWSKVNTGRNGANLETGRNWTLAVDPTDADVVYTVAGYGFDQGLWKSLDGGVNWSQMLPDDVRAAATSDIYSIAINPDDHNHLLLGTHSPWGEGATDAGVLESRDGGTTWIVHDAQGPWGAGHYVFFIDTNTWLLTTQGAGFWRTTDSGVSWDQVAENDMQHGGNQLYRTSDGTLYVGAYATLVRSTDDGASWTEVGPRTPDGYNAVIGDGEFLYALAANTGSNTVDPDPPWFVSREDDGQTWTPFNPGNPAIANGPMSMAFDPLDRILYSSNWNAGVWKLELGPGD